MDQRDLELLNKQFRWHGPSPRTDGVLISAVTAIFVVGISVSIGAILFARETHSAQTVSNKLLAAPSGLKFSKSEILPR